MAQKIGDPVEMTFAALKEALTLDAAKFMAVPMNLIDGRPWVPTEAEATP